MTNLVTPLTEETVRSLRLGDTVFVNGPIVTGRDEAHIRALELRAEGKEHDYQDPNPLSVPTM